MKLPGATLWMVASAVKDPMNPGCEMDSRAASSVPWKLPETLQRLALDGDAELVAEVISDFESDTARRLRVLREGLSQANAAVARAQAHAIKGAAAEMGAEHLAAVCARIELTAAARAAGDVAGLLKEAENIFHHVCRQMSESGWLIKSSAAKRTA